MDSITYKQAADSVGGVAVNPQTGAVTTATPTGTSTSAYSYTDPNGFSTGGGATQTAIPADQMGATTAIKVPGVSTDTSGASAAVAGATEATKSIQDYLKEITPPETATSKGYNDLLGQINTLLPDLANKSGDQLKAEQDQNLPQLKKDLAGLNSQILTRSAEYNKLQTDIEGKTIPMQFITGQQAQVQKQQASEIGLLQARALGLQGQVEIAQQTANRAIDLKYSVLEDTLNVKMKQLQLIQPLLDKEEQRYSDALSLYYRDQQQKLAEEKDASKLNMQLSLEAGIATRYWNKAGTIIRTSDGYAFSSPEEFFKESGVTSWQDPRLATLVSDYNPQSAAETQIVTASGRTLLINSQTGETIKDLGGAYKPSGGSGGGTSDKELLDQAISEAGHSLQGEVGSDGFISPEVWNDALSQWVAAGFSAKSFNDNFGRFVNPADPQDYNFY